MDTYKLHPVRCFTCGNQIQARADAFEYYSEIYGSMEDAANSLGLMEPCCRIALMVPTIINFNMENRRLVETLRSDGSLNHRLTQKENAAVSVFGSCMTGNVPGRNLNTTGAPAKLLFDNKLSTNISDMQVDMDNVSSKIAGISTGTEITENDMKNKGIPLNQLKLETDEENFVYPTMVGIPVINYNKNLKEEYADVGDNKKVLILNGRTYLAR